MDENNKELSKNEHKSEHAKKPAQGKKTMAESFADWRKGCMGEFKKIVWPSRPELLKKTFTVIVVSLLIGGVIIVMDTAFSTGFTSFISLVSQS